MDIHKPKPVHNWREFLKEYAIIVLGVATALAAEQGVEWLHWQSEVGSARQAIHAEMAENNSRYFARRVAIASCVDRQINEAEAILTALEEKRPPGKFTNFTSGSGGLINASEWENQRASQVLTHFPRNELAAMSLYYAIVPTFDAWNVTEGAAWADLSVLQKPLAGMTTSDLIHLRASLAVARNMGGLISLNARRQLERSRQAGVAETKLDPAVVRQYCTMSTEALRRLRATQEEAR